MNPIQQTLLNLQAARPQPKPTPPNRWQLVGHNGASPIVRVPGGQPFAAGTIETNGSIVAGSIHTRQSGDTLRIDGIPRSRRREIPVVKGSKFALYVCIDQTGSIGLEGLRRTIEIIDEFALGSVQGRKLVGIGYLSFGDQMCRIRDVGDPIAIRAELQQVLDAAPPAPPGGYDAFNSSPLYEGFSDFFCDAGGDLPENGPDALAKALEKLAAFKDADQKYIYLKTDTWGFRHNVTPEAQVLADLDQLKLTFLEFDKDSPPSLQIGTSYALAFPEGPKITHRGFNLT
jgi:hypothetical protein